MRRRLTRRKPTLGGRVSLLALTTIAGWLVLLAVALDVIVSQRLDQQIDDTLRLRAQAVSTVIEITGGKLVGVRESSTDSDLDSGIWVFAGQRVVAAPHARGRAAQTAAELAGGAAGFSTRHDRRFYVLPLTADGHRIGTVVAGLDTDPYLKTKRLVMIASGAVALLVLIGAYPILRISTKRALRPMTAMTDQAAQWSVYSPTQRFGADQRYAELQALAGSLDELLDRVSALMRHERQLNAELSHELRTPLARVMTETELALAGDPSQHAAALGAIRDNCTDLNTMIDALLAAARGDLSRTVAHADLDEVFVGFTAKAAGGPTLDAKRTRLGVGVDREIVTRILAPIIDNAVRYAASTVRLGAYRSGSDVVVVIGNDGHPLAPELVEQIFVPGFRAPSPENDHQGAGLGLALAQRLARAADGGISVRIIDDCTTFEVTLPAG